MKLVNKIKILLLAVVLFTNNLSAQTSSVGALSTLYANGHPRNNIDGQVYGIAAYENFLYTSWHYFTDPEIDRNEEIHIWNIANPTNPQLIGVLAFPGLLEGSEQILNIPKSLAVIKGHLVFWSANRLYVYSINRNGSLTEQLVNAFEDDLNPSGTGIFDIKGSYASTFRTMLSNNEFLQDQNEDRLSDYALINLQNPVSPYLEKLNRDVGKDLLYLNTKLNGTYSGFPSSVELNQDNNALSVSTMAHRRTAHFRKFWKGPLMTLLGRKRLNVSLGAINNSIVSRMNSKELRTKLFNSFARKLRINNNYGFNDAISATYGDEILIKDALVELKIDLQDSLHLALEKIIERVVRNNFDGDLENIIGKELLKSFNIEFFGSKERSIFTFKNELRSNWQALLDEQGLSAYLVNTVLNPLVGDQELLRLTLGQVIGRISNSELGDATNLALGFFHSLYPQAAIESGLPFDVPQCFRIPRTSSELLRKLLINAGARLNSDGIALFELIKLADFYTGSGNYRRLTTRLNNQLRDLHIKLADEFSSTVLNSLNIIAAPNVNLDRALLGLADNLQLEKTISIVLADLISQRLEAANINTSLSVSAFLDSQNLYTDPLLLPVGGSLSTIADLKAKVTELGLAQVSLTALMRQAINSGRASISAIIGQVSKHLLKQIFGDLSDQVSLEKALENLILSKLSGKPVADFVSNTLNSVLETVKDEIPLPDVLGVISLSSRGDCIAQWQKAILATQAFATGSVVFAELLPVLQSWNSSLTVSYEHTLKFITQTLLERFVTGIFNEAVGDYSSWVSRPIISNYNIPLDSILDSPASNVTPVSFQNVVGVVATNADAFGNLGNNMPVNLITFNPSDVAATKSTLSLGEWLSVENVAYLDSTLLLQGKKLIDDFPAPASLLINFNANSTSMQDISGNLADSISYANNLTLVRGGQVLALSDITGKVVLMQTGKR
jgi:hypothetical protein